MTLTSGIHRASCSTYFHITDYHCFGKILFHLFLIKIPKHQIWSWWKIGQGQPTVTIWTNLVVSTQSPDATYQVSKDINPVVLEKKFLRFLPHMIMEAILVIWPGPFEQTLDPLLPRCCIRNLIEIGPVVSEKKMFDNVDKHSILVTWGKGQWNDLDLWHSQRFM